MSKCRPVLFRALAASSLLVHFAAPASTETNYFHPKAAASVTAAFGVAGQAKTSISLGLPKPRPRGSARKSKSLVENDGRSVVDADEVLRSREVPVPADAAAAAADETEAGERVGLRPLLDAIASAAPLRENDADARRIFHGRGGFYPGPCERLTLDYFPPVFVLTSFNRNLTRFELDLVGGALEERWSERRRDGEEGVAGERECEGDVMTDDSDEDDSSSGLNLVYQSRNSSSPLSSFTRIVSGTVPSPHVVTAAGGTERFLVRVDRDLNNGLFLDMAEGRSYVRRLASELASERRGEGKGKGEETVKVLNLFAYTCSFSVAALVGGADEVVNVDMSRGALNVGKRNHELNGFGGGAGSIGDNEDGSGTDDDGGGERRRRGTARFLPHDVFKTWGKIRKLGPYDIIVVDPPTYQKGSFVASRHYGKLVRRVPSLLRSGGGACILLCLNAPELGTDFLTELVEAEAPELRFMERLADASGFEAIADRERALKVLVYEMPPSTYLVAASE